LFRVLYYLPVVTSVVVVSLLFRFLFADQGAINGALGALHLTDGTTSWLADRWTGMIAIAIAGIWKGIGWGALIGVPLLAAVAFVTGRRGGLRNPGTVLCAAIASLIVPGLVLSIGTLVTFRYLGLTAAWYTSALGAHLSWALPFGLVIMFAILGRLNPSYQEAAF